MLSEREFDRLCWQMLSIGESHFQMLPKDDDGTVAPEEFTIDEHVSSPGTVMTVTDFCEWVRFTGHDPVARARRYIYANAIVGSRLDLDYEGYEYFDHDHVDDLIENVDYQDPPYSIDPDDRLEHDPLPEDETIKSTSIEIDD